MGWLIVILISNYNEVEISVQRKINYFITENNFPWVLSTFLQSSLKMCKNFPLKTCKFWRDSFWRTGSFLCQTSYALSSEIIRLLIATHTFSIGQKLSTSNTFSGNCDCSLAFGSTWTVLNSQYKKFLLSEAL